MTSDTVEQIATVLAAAGPAHHTAYIETDGDDPEWPLWYAEHVIEYLRTILQRPGLTVSRVVWAFVDSDESHRRDAPDTPWHGHYAERFADQLRPTRADRLDPLD